MKTRSLFIDKLSVSVDQKIVLQDVSLEIEQSSVHALMGPNGSGKSTLAYALMGHPRYEIVSGSVYIGETDIIGLSPDKRARAGLFLAFQHPCEIPGVSVASFLREAYMTVTGKVVSVVDFRALLENCMEQLAIDKMFAQRGLNEGFSGGEKKRFEVLQLLMLKPTIVILDEIDSGLDIDSLKIVAQGIAYARAENPIMSIVLITHYQRILEYIIPDHVHILQEGGITASGDAALVMKLEQGGYDAIKKV